MTDTNLGFITEVSSGLPRIQRAAVLALIEEQRRQNLFVNRQQMSEVQQKILAETRSRGRAFTAPFAANRAPITAEYFNDAFDRIKVDLTILYNQIGIMSSDNARLQAVTNSNFISTKASINELITQLRLFRFLKLNPEFSDAKFVQFANATNRTRFLPKADVDKKSRQLKMPLEQVARLGTSRFNLDRVIGEVTHFGGGISGRDNVNFGIDKSLDDNPETFFADLVLSQGIPSHTYRLSHTSNQRRLGSGWQKGHRFESHGLVFEMKYLFSKTASCNQLRLYPIADYPVRIVDLAYKTSDSVEDWTPVPDFDPANYEETLDWIEWNGRRFHMTQLKVVFEQANYTTNIYHLPTDMLKNNQLWSQILDNGYQSIIHDIELDEVVADKIAVEPGVLPYLNELNDLGVSISKVDLRGSGGRREYDVAETLQGLAIEQMARTNPSEGRNSFDPAIQTSALTEVKRLQFVCGLRVVEVNDNSYVPFSFYESQKFESTSNILEVELATTEEHQTIPDAILGKPFNLTSVEWEIEAGENTFFPIAPVQNKTTTDNGNVFVEIKDEVMVLNKRDNFSITRFPVYSTGTAVAPIQIRKNGTRLNPMIPNSGLGGQAPQLSYTTEFMSNGHVKVAFNDKYFDQRAVYTISYWAKEEAATIDINDRINSDKTVEPETFDGVDKDNRVQLKYYPYVEYEIVNNADTWIQDDPNIPKWRFVPTTENYTQGTVDVTGGTTVTGYSTNWITGGAQELLTGLVNGISGAAFQLVGDSRIYPISGFTSSEGLVTYDPIETGFLPVGSQATGLPYVIGKVQELDGQNYGLTNVNYEPIEIYVNDVKAINRTDYSTLEHQAFIPVDPSSRIFEYIQAGKNIYFNANIDGKIEIEYRYLTEYLKVNATLRSHKPVNAVTTPLIKDYTVRLKTSKI